MDTAGAGMAAEVIRIERAAAILDEGATPIPLEPSASLRANEVTEAFDSPPE